MKDRMSHPFIAKEGWVHLATVSAMVLLGSMYSAYLGAVLFLLFVFVLQFFRDPTRVTIDDASLVSAPADGRVIVAQEDEDPYTGSACLKISIFMNVFNVHSNRSPCAGTIVKRSYSPGRFFNAALDKASDQNERNALVMKTDQGHQITFVQVAGLIARRILCYVGEGDSVSKGQRYGFIRFGSRVDVYLPRSARPKVSLGDKVVGGVTSIAEIA